VDPTAHRANQNVRHHLEVALPPGDCRDDPTLTAEANNALTLGVAGEQHALVARLRAVIEVKDAELGGLRLPGCGLTWKLNGSCGGGWSWTAVRSALGELSTALHCAR